MPHWIYEHSGNHRARIHLGTCRHCNDGAGRIGAAKEPRRRWHGPYDTRRAARAKMKAFDYDDMKDCEICLKN